MSEPLARRRIGIYLRLSREDEREGESASVENQRTLLHRYISEHGGAVAEEYVDDGFSGTDFERPGIKRLLSDAQSGRIDAVVVKDLSRFGRNYIEVGQYIDYIFPAYGVRFIAVNDNVDTDDRASAAMDMMPIMNVFNEWHAASTSRKIRAVLGAKQRAGKYTGWSYPYGYRAGKDENRTAVIDEPAAAVVRRIYAMRAAGRSIRRIAAALNDEGISNPTGHYVRLDGARSSRKGSRLWSPKTVADILTDRTYLGQTAQHRTARVSYKNHRTVEVPEHEWLVRTQAHEPIIGRDLWETVQAVNHASSRGKADGRGEIHPLSGLVVCPDCGKKMKFERGREGEGAFLCRTYKDFGKKYCSSHRIGEKALNEIVLKDIRPMARGATCDAKREKERFMREYAAREGEDAESALKECYSRLSELDRLIRAAFEERVLGGLSPSVCETLCASYEEEKRTVEKRIGELETNFSEGRDRAAERFAAGLGRAIGCETLTRGICLQLIDCIFVGEKTEDGSPRKLVIRYRCRPPALDAASPVFPP